MKKLFTCVLVMCLTSLAFAQSNTSVRRFPVLVSFNKVWLWVPWFGHTGREPYIDKKGVLRVDAKAICIYFSADCKRNDQTGNIHIYLPLITKPKFVGQKLSERIVYSRADILAKDIVVQKDFLGEDSYMVPLKSFAKVFGFSMRWDKRSKRAEATIEVAFFSAPAGAFLGHHSLDYMGDGPDFSFYPNFRAQFDVGPAFIDLVVNKDGNIFVDNFKDKFEDKTLWLNEFSYKIWRVRKLGVGTYSPEYFIAQNSRPLIITNPNYIPFDSLNNKSGASCVRFKKFDFTCGVPVIPNDTQYNMHVGNSFRLPGTIPYVAGYLYPFFPKSRQKQYYPCAPQKPCTKW